MPAVSIVSYLLAACALLLLLSEVGAGSGSRRTLLGYVAATVALAYTGAIVQDASAAQSLTGPEARAAARNAVRQSLAGFTERKPTVVATCALSGSRATCRVGYRGDRLHARMNARIAELDDGYRVTLGHLEVVKPKPKPKPWSFALASWYQLTGSPLGCPPYRRMDTGTLGVAHKTLACGTRVRLSYRGRYVTAVVNDRGPYVGGREFDLSGAVRNALGFDGVDTIRWRLAR